MMNLFLSKLNVTSREQDELNNCGASASVGSGASLSMMGISGLARIQNMSISGQSSNKSSIYEGLRIPEQARVHRNLCMDLTTSTVSKSIGPVQILE